MRIRASTHHSCGERGGLVSMVTFVSQKTNHEKEGHYDNGLALKGNSLVVPLPEPLKALQQPLLKGDRLPANGVLSEVPLSPFLSSHPFIATTSGN